MDHELKKVQDKVMTLKYVIIGDRVGFAFEEVGG
mgnify:CR=1 FL=1